MYHSDNQKIHQSRNLLSLDSNASDMALSAADTQIWAELTMNCSWRPGLPISQMIGPSLEVFAVASYLNHHDSWSDEIRRKMEREASDDGVSNFSSDNHSSVTETSKKLYT